MPVDEETMKIFTIKKVMITRNVSKKSSYSTAKKKREKRDVLKPSESKLNNETAY